MNKIVIVLVLFLMNSISSISLINDTRHDDEVMNAMRDEISRSLKKLKLETIRTPYFVEYTLRIRDVYNVKSDYGLLTESNYMRYAMLNVGVRVGDYKFDNTNFFDVGLSFFGSSDDEESFRNRQIPVEIDYPTLRRELWLATDAAYKQAAELYSKKEAILKNLMRRDTIPDFLEMPPTKTSVIQKIPDFDVKKFEELAKSLSATFKNYHDIINSTVGIEYLPEKVYYVNSEGTEYITTDFYTGLEIVAFTQSEDGMPLTNFYTALGKSPNDLPTKDSLLNASKIVADVLSKTVRTKPLEEAYSGPVVFSYAAAGELIAQSFAPNFVTQRAPLAEGGTAFNDRFGAFQNKVGGRVLPEFISVIADPISESMHGTSLLGSFELDGDGLKTGVVSLVENGYLKNLLSERIPTRRIKQSNAHKRGGSAMLSNIIFKSDSQHTVNQDSLINRMMELCKARELPYGVVITKLLNQNILFTTLFRIAYGAYQPATGNNVITIVEAYKVYPDGKRELMRGGELSGVNVQSFKDVLLMGNTNYVHNFLSPAVISPFITGGDQYLGVSVVSGDLLFEDVEIRISERDYKKPPILKSPFK